MRDGFAGSTSIYKAYSKHYASRRNVGDRAKLRPHADLSELMNVHPGSISIPLWYAVHTRSNHEKIVALALTARDLACYLPIYETISRWQGRYVRLERPLFPGYLFVRIPAAEKLKVATVPSVVNVLCARGKDDAIYEWQIDRLRHGLQMRPAEPHPVLAIGQRVQIVAGPFAGMEGVLVKRRNASRVVIALENLMRAFSVEVGMHEVAPSQISDVANTAWSQA